MKYRHNPPALVELRQLRREAEGSSELDKAKLNQYEHDIIIAHLENQNELLLEIMRKIEKK